MSLVEYYIDGRLLREWSMDSISYHIQYCCTGNYLKIPIPNTENIEETQKFKDTYSSISSLKTYLETESTTHAEVVKNNIYEIKIVYRGVDVTNQVLKIK